MAVFLLSVFPLFLFAGLHMIAKIRKLISEYAVFSTIFLFAGISVVRANSLYSISIPGMAMLCDGSDHYLIFMKSCPSPIPSTPSAIACTSTPGGAPVGWAWPTQPITIWSVDYTIITNDTTSQSEVGLLGSGGDLLTPTMIGSGYVSKQHPPLGRYFDPSTDRLDFHVLCRSGYYAIIQGSFEYSIP